MYLHLFTCIYMYLHVFTCIYIYLYVFTCIYIYSYSITSLKTGHQQYQRVMWLWVHPADVLHVFTRIEHYLKVILT